MKYPRTGKLHDLVRQIDLYIQLQHEYGAGDIATILKEVEKTLGVALGEIKKLPVDAKMAAKEPNELEKIQALRPKGPRRM